MEQEEGRRKKEPAVVVVLECVAGSSKAEEWGGGGDVVQEGDVVEAVRVGLGSGAESLDPPFKGGRAGLHKALHKAFKRGDTSVEVRVRGGRGLQACILPHPGGGRKQYVLRSLHDPNYVLGFGDRLESECLVLQGTRGTRVASALSKAQLQDGYVAYPWEKKMRDSLRIPNSSCHLSMLVLPKALDMNACRYESFEDTLARASAWLYSSQDSGIPVEFINVQSEALLTKISGETASATVNSGSLSDMSNLVNATLYGFEDYHGVDIGVVKAARLWYSSTAGEIPLEILLQEGDTRLGFAVSRTEEGFIYISSVVDDDEDNEAPSTRSGLRDLFRRAKEASKLLIISRVSNEKVLPWMISSSGAVRCFDTISLSQKLSLHRLALHPIQLHLLMWEKPVGLAQSIIFPPKLPPQLLLPQVPQNIIESIEPLDVEEDYVGDQSFRFVDSPVSSWV
ncbi:uncharacterized protein LOC100830767 [Brachypodium distachyon]|uniref:Uncharacterized protein n=1 Tax=Brachypodium distachyon TaxID=15368 RepID=I1IR91_BRADI|nr:uncharacterized protein LOC100830767 [Brachypodium distachyon]KQJ90749.1 hypothetical protein BRADI_4g33710v3 [Brachypodium distachyon]|eukprot:XP_003576678.1 uncharacterized protein LOC100830767 [Brachypodium distachyon]